MDSYHYCTAVVLRRTVNNFWGQESSLESSHLTLKTTSSQVVKMLVTKNSHSQDIYTDSQIPSRYDIPGLKQLLKLFQYFNPLTPRGSPLTSKIVWR